MTPRPCLRWRASSGARVWLAASRPPGSADPGGVYPGRTGGPWLCRTLILSGFHAVVVPSAFRIRVQPHRWL